MLPHPSAPFDTKSASTPFVPFSHGHKQIDFTDAPSTEGGTDTHTVLVFQPVHPSCVLLHIRFTCIYSPMQIGYLRACLFCLLGFAFLAHSDELCYQYFLLWLNVRNSIKVAVELANNWATGLPLLSLLENK